MRTKEQINAYTAAYKRRKRRERGLLPKGGIRLPRTEEQKEKAKQARRDWEKEWRKTYVPQHPINKMLNSARRRAKDQGLDFNLEKSDIIIPEVCPYLGIKLSPHSRRGDSKKTVMSLDRIDPTKGYVKGNVEVISWQANTMKSDATAAELIMFAKVVLSKFGNEDSN